MFSTTFYIAATFLAFIINDASSSSETITGPVEFLWPEQRPWYAAWQTNSPCGTNDGRVGNRTEFPLDSGKVSLTVAGDTWDIMIRIAYVDEPTTQSDFTAQIVHTVSELEAGHQCYPIPDTPSEIQASSNATIQLEYTSTYAGSANETFYACADITFVEDSDFTTSVSCFNVSISDPSPDGIATSTPSSTPSSALSSTISTSSLSSTSSHSSGLSSGAKAGIAIGCIVGGIALLVAGAFALMRKYKYKPTFRGRNEIDDKAVRMTRIDDKSSLAR